LSANALAFAALKADGSIMAWGGSTHGGSGEPTDSDYIKIYFTSVSLILSTNIIMNLTDIVYCKLSDNIQRYISQTKYKNVLKNRSTDTVIVSLIIALEATFD
jgi:hypothetical protein